MKFDLHMHSIHSDGNHSVEELFSFAKSANLDYFSITDHDNLNSIDDALKIKDNYNINYILGLELSTYYLGRSIHVLAYFKNKEQINEEIYKLLEDTKLARIARAKAYINSLNMHYNLGIDFNDLKIKNGIIARPHIADLISKKHNIEKNECFDLYLGMDNVAFIPATKTPTDEAVKLLKKSGAVVVFAHPCLLKKESVDIILNDIDFDGIEVSHPQNNENDYEYFYELATTRNLLKTSGSDFHRFNDSKHADVGTNTLEGLDVEIFINRLYGTK